MGSKEVKWDISSRCNLRCAHCSVAKKYFTAQPRELDLDDKLKIIDKLAEAEVTGLSLLGGEPLTLGTDLVTVIEHAVASGIRVSMVTNGLLLHGQLMESLIDSGIERIVVSVEGATQATHEFIRGKGTFSKVVENIRGLMNHIDCAHAPVCVGINTVLNRLNCSQLQQMMDLCRELGVSDWTLLSLVGTGFAEDNMETLAITPHDEIEAARIVAGLISKANSCGLTMTPLFVYPLVTDYLRERYGVTMPSRSICCTAAVSLGFIGPEGNLYPCDRVCTEHYVDRAVCGATYEPMSLVDHSFYDIWNSNYYVKMFELIVSEDTYRQYSPCNHCRHLKTGACNPCPLYSLDSRVIINSCRIAEEYLGDISTVSPASSCLEGMFSPGLWSRSEKGGQKLDTRDTAVHIPVKAAGVRSGEREGRLFLVNPHTVEPIGLNVSARAMWELVDGVHTVEDISSQVGAALLELKDRIAPRSTAVELRAEVDANAAALFHMLWQRGFITWAK